MEEGDGTRPTAVANPHHADPTADLKLVLPSDLHAQLAADVTIHTEERSAGAGAAAAGGGYGLKMLVVSSPRSKNKSLRVLEEALAPSGRSLRRSVISHSPVSEHVFTVDAIDEEAAQTTSCVDVAVRDAAADDTDLNLVLPDDLHTQLAADVTIHTEERRGGYGLQMLVVSSPRSKNKSLRVLEEALAPSGRALQRSIISHPSESEEVLAVEGAAGAGGADGGGGIPPAQFSTPTVPDARLEDIVDDILERKGRGKSIAYDGEIGPLPGVATPPVGLAHQPNAGSRPAVEAAASDAGATAAAPASAPASDAGSATDGFHRRWRAVKKHIFIYSSASRPIYTRFGDETDFLELFGMLGLLANLTTDTLQATAKRDPKYTGKHAPSTRAPTEMNYVRTGGRVYVFARYYDINFCIASVTNESVKQLEAQMRFLNSVLLSMLTSSMYAIFQKRHNYDLRGLMGESANALIQGATRYMNNNPGFALSSIPVVPARRQTREQITKSFRAAVRECGVETSSAVYGFLLYHTQGDDPYGGVAGSNSLLLVSHLTHKHPIHPKDFGVLSTFVLSSLPPSSKYQAIFSPCCLPEYDPDGFLYLYCAYVTPSVCLVLASTSTDCFPQFAAVKDALVVSFGVKTAEPRGADRPTPVPQEPTTGPLSQLTRATLYGVADMDTPERGVPTDVMHFLYKDSNLHQHTATRFAAPFLHRREQKLLLRAYLKAREGAQAASGAKRTMIHTTEHYTVLVRIGKYYECFMCFQPGTPVAAFADWPSVLKKWVRNRSDDVFCALGQL